MKKLWFGQGIALLVALASAGALQAQVFTPTFTSPRMTNDIGVYLSDGPGDLAVEGIWRGGPLGVRVGYLDGTGSTAGSTGGVLSIGGELRSPLQITGAPLGLAFTAGAQGLIGDESAVGLQAGVSAGYTFVPGSVAFTPYIHPRVALINDFGPGDDFNVELLADVGVDVELWNNLIFRFGANLGDIGSNWGVGLAIRR